MNHVGTSVHLEVDDKCDMLGRLRMAQHLATASQRHLVGVVVALQMDVETAIRRLNVVTQRIYQEA